MMQLILWLLACVAAALLLRRRPAAAALLVLGIWFTVPAAGSYLLTGQDSGSLSLHAATWLIFAVVGVQLIAAPSVMAGAVATHIYVVVILLMVLGSAVLSTIFSKVDGGTVLLIDQIVAPALFFLFITGSSVLDPQLVVRLRNGLLALGALVCVVGLAQWVTGSVLFYEDGFATRYWFNPEGTRWMGLLDQPLALSMAACVIAPLTIRLRWAWLQVLLLVLLGAGVLVSQSRVGVMIMIAVVLFVILANPKPVMVRVGMAAVIGAITAWAVSSPLAEGLLERLQDDNGSAEARGFAISTFLSDWPQFLLTGHGVNSSYQIAEEAGLGTSLESSFLMYGVDLGIFFSLLYFGALLMLLLVSFRRTFSSGLAIAGLLAIVIPQTYSALATRSVAGILLWTVIAMVACENQRRRQDTEAVRVPASERLAAWGVRSVPAVPALQSNQPLSTQGSSS